MTIDGKYDLPLALVRRWERRRGATTEVEDLIPDVSRDDLRAMTEQLVLPLGKPATGLKRQNIADQYGLLTKQFEGRAQILMVHALCISYLRRSTQLTEKANRVFRMIWEQEADFLRAQLTGRWLISALQTFHDHGETEGERLAGAAGFLYGNLIKIYETERNTMREKNPSRLKLNSFKNKSFPELWDFVPGDDILININAFVYGAAANGGLASTALLRLLEMTYRSKSIFARVDALQHVAPFSEHPTFTRSFEGR